jgi:hypothetical protein
MVSEGRTARQWRAFRQRRGHAQHPTSAPAPLFHFPSAAPCPHREVAVRGLLPHRVHNRTYAAPTSHRSTGQHHRARLHPHRAGRSSCCTARGLRPVTNSRVTVSPMCPGASGGCPSATSCTTLPGAAGRIHIRAPLRQSVSALHTVEVLKDMDTTHGKSIGCFSSCRRTRLRQGLLSGREGVPDDGEGDYDNSIINDYLYYAGGTLTCVACVRFSIRPNSI